MKPKINSVTTGKRAEFEVKLAWPEDHDDEFIVNFTPFGVTIDSTAMKALVPKNGGTATVGPNVTSPAGNKGSVVATCACIVSGSVSVAWAKVDVV